MDSRRYWNRRYLLDKAGCTNTGEDFLRETVGPLYQKALREIEEEVGGMYAAYASQESITLAEAKRKISRADFRKTDFEARARGQAKRQGELRRKKGILPDAVVESMEGRHKRYEAALAAYTKKGQITRLELLHVEIEKTLLDMYDESQMNIYEFLARQYQDGYYRSVYRNQKMAGFGKNFAALHRDAVAQAVLNSYGNGNYSTRLWQHCSHLSKDLRENITVGLIRGESLGKMAARIGRRMQVSKNNAYRLVRTETAYIYEQAAMKAYGECGIEKYEYLATLDGRTSKSCREMDGRVFLLKDAMPGKNYPPMHPNCRSTTVAAFDEGEDVAGKRLAKSGGGKYYEVPGTMTYKEWYKKHADEQGSQWKKRAGKVLDNMTDLREPIKLQDIQYGETVRKIVEGSRTDAAKLLLKHYDRIFIINTSPSIAAYSPSKKGIRIDMGKALHDRRGRFNALFHEIGHSLDHIMGSPSEGTAFRKALGDDALRLFTALIINGRCANMEDAYQYTLRNIKRDEYGDISDLLGGLTGNKAGRGHDKIYWEQDSTKIGKEAFAHFFAASLNEDKAKLRAMKESFPSAFQMYEEMIRDGL